MITKSKELIAQVLELHKNKSNTNKQIASILNIKPKTVSEILIKAGKRSNSKSKTIEYVGDSEAKCSRCGLILPISLFQYGRKSAKYEYRFSYCNSCRNKSTYLRNYATVESSFKYRFSALRTRCKRFGIDFDLELSDLLDAYKRQNGKCFYTDVPLSYQRLKYDTKNALSIDRVDCRKGYLKNNIVLCTVRANTTKNDLSLNEMKAWLPFLVLQIKISGLY